MRFNPKEKSLARLPKSAAVKLISQPEKRILMLVSIGQVYHEGTFLKAAVDLLAQQIRICRDIAEDEIKWQQSGINLDSIKGRWIINVVCADTLQVRNHIEHDYRQALLKLNNNLEDHDDELRQAVLLSLIGSWCEKGEAYQKNARAAYTLCQSAGQSRSSDRQLIDVEINIKTWSELFGETPEIPVLIEDASPQQNFSVVTHHQFWGAYNCLRLAYENKINELMFFAKQTDPKFKKNLEEACQKVYREVNKKGYAHLQRDESRLETFRKMLRAKEEVSYFPKGKLDELHKLPSNLCDYILVEFAYLAHCLALGCDFPEKIRQDCPTYIMYPHMDSFPALREIQGLFNLIFAQERRNEVDYLGYDVTHNFSENLDKYCVGASEPGIEAIERLQKVNVGIIIAELRGAEPFTIEAKNERLEFNLPLRDDKFVPRPAVREKMEALFSSPPTAETETRYAALGFLQGIGGMGKTQIVLDYCHHPLHKYNLVIWINASGKNLDKLYHQLAMDLFLYQRGQKVEESVRKVRQYLAEHPGWLLILDDIDEDVLQHELKKASRDDASFFQGKRFKQKIFSSVIPESGGHVLMTSRLTGWQGKGVIDVNEMDPECAVNLLKKRLDARFGQSDRALADLAKTLDFYPLALAHAAAYIVLTYDANKPTPDAAIYDYIKEYQEMPTKVLGAEVGNNTENPHHHVSAVKTLKLLLNRIQPPKEKDVTLARELLSVMALVQGDLIQHDLIEEWVKQAKPDKEGKLPEALAKLLQAFLVTPHNAHSYRMHKVVQDILLEWVVEKEENAKIEPYEMRVSDKWYQSIMAAILDFIEHKKIAAGPYESQNILAKTISKFLEIYHSRKLANLKEYESIINVDYCLLLRIDAALEEGLKGYSRSYLSKMLYFLYVIEMLNGNLESGLYKEAAWDFIDYSICGVTLLKIRQVEEFDHIRLNLSKLSEADMDNLYRNGAHGNDSKNSPRKLFFAYLAAVKNRCGKFLGGIRDNNALTVLIREVSLFLKNWQENDVCDIDEILFLIFQIIRKAKYPHFKLYTLICGYLSKSTGDMVVVRSRLEKAVVLCKAQLNLMSENKFFRDAEKAVLYTGLVLLYARLGRQDEMGKVLDEINRLRRNGAWNETAEHFYNEAMAVSNEIKGDIIIDIDANASREEIIIFEAKVASLYANLTIHEEEQDFDTVQCYAAEIMSKCEEILKISPTYENEEIEVIKIRHFLQLLKTISDKEINDYFRRMLALRFGEKIYDRQGAKQLIFNAFENYDDMVTICLMIYLWEFYFNVSSDLFLPFLHLDLKLSQYPDISADTHAWYFDRVENLLITGINIAEVLDGDIAFDLVSGDEQMTNLLLEYLDKNAAQEKSTATRFAPQ